MTISRPGNDSGEYHAAHHQRISYRAESASPTRQDEEGHWVAELVCGHAQHVRHKPPFAERHWVLTEKDRSRKLGIELECKLCDEQSMK